MHTNDYYNFIAMIPKRLSTVFYQSCTILYTLIISSYRRIARKIKTREFGFINNARYVYTFWLMIMPG